MLEKWRASLIFSLGMSMVFNGLFRGDVNHVDFFFFSFTICGDDSCEELLEQGRLGLSKQQKVI